jgi:hypothetical protein
MSLISWVFPPAHFKSGFAILSSIRYLGFQFVYAKLSFKNMFLSKVSAKFSTVYLSGGGWAFGAVGQNKCEATWVGLCEALLLFLFCEG